MDKVLSFIKDHKKIVIAVSVAVVVLILVIIAAVVISNMKPMGYKKKIEAVGSALCSEDDMEKAIEENIDLRGVVAWQEADQKSKKFKEEYKDVKKDDKDVKDAKEALIDYADDNSSYYSEVEVEDIKKPKKDSKNKNISTVKATLKYKGEYSDTERDVKFVFYKNKIIDIQATYYGVESSMFESILK